MIIKQPAAYDISHWKEVADFNAISPRPVLMITKATEGTSLIDGKFVRFFNGMRDAGYHRGAYHFFRRAVGANAQALFFCNFIEPHIDNHTILILDVEEEGVEASMMWAWFSVVRKIYPANLAMLYGRKEQLDRILMTTPEKEYFKRIPTWPAGYPFLPDNYATVPAFYVPDQGKYGPPWLWQYSEKGSVFGIQGAVDLNWISPELQQYLVTEEPPTPDGENMTLYKGTVITTVTLQLRSSPESTPTNDIGDLRPGDKLEASAIVNGWWKITSVNGQARSGYAFANAGRYIRTDAEIADPPAEPPTVTLTHTIKVFSDGSIQVDDQPVIA